MVLTNTETSWRENLNITYKYSHPLHTFYELFPCSNFSSI